MKNEPIELLREIRRHNSSGLTKDMQGRIDAALSQQADPCEFHGCDRAACEQHSGSTPCEPAPAQDEREAFEAAAADDSFGNLRALGEEAERRGLEDGDYIDFAARKAWEYFQAGAAWQRARPAQTEQQPEQEPFWYAVVSEQAPTINSAIKRLDVAQEFADSKRERWPDTRVVPLYATPQPEQSGLSGKCWIEVIDGREGPSIYIGDGEIAHRLAGNKPWGGGTTLHRFAVDILELVREATALSAQGTKP